MKSATLQLIELAESLNPTGGEIGDGTVAQFHKLAAVARVELERLRLAIMRAEHV